MSLPAAKPGASALDRLNQLLECCACARTFHAPEGCSKHDVFDQECPGCKARDSKVHREVPDVDFVEKARSVAIEREWHGKETVALEAPIIAPEHQKNWVRDCPSMTFNAKGEMTFKSDRHQRKVYEEINATRRRNREQDQERSQRHGQ